MTVMLRRTMVTFLAMLVGLQISQPAWGQDDETDRLQGEISRLQKAFDYFREERDQLKLELEKEEQKTKQLNDRLRRFAEALEKNRKVIAVYKKKLSSMVGTPGELQKKLDRANAQIVVLESTRDQLNGQIEQLTSNLVKEQRLRKAQEQMTQEKELSAHDAELLAETSNRKIMLLESERDKLLGEIDALTAQTEKDYTGYLVLEQRLEEFERKADADSATIRSGEAEVAQLRQALDKADEEYQGLQRDLAKKEADYKDKLRRAKSTLKKMEQLKEDKAMAEEKLSALQTELKLEQQQRRAIEKSGQNFEQDSVELASKLDEERRNVVRLEEERTQLLEDVDVFEKALEEERARRQVQEDLARRMKSSGSSTQRDLETARLKLANATSAREAAEAQQEKLQKTLDSLMVDRRASSQNAEDLQYEFNELSVKYENVQRALKEVNARSKNAIKNVALLKKALARERKLRTDRESVSSELEALQANRENELDELTVRLTEEQAARRDAATQNEMLKEALAAERKNSAVLNASLEKERTARDRIDQALSQQEALLKEARAEGMQAGRSEMADKVARQKRKEKELNNQLKSMDDQLEAERQRGYEMAQLDLNEKISQLNKQVERTTREVKTLEASLVDQRELLAKERRNKTVESNKDLIKQIASLEKRLREEQRRTQEKKPPQSEQENKRLRRQLAAREKSVEQLKDALAEKNELIRRQQLQLKQKSAVVGASPAPGSSVGTTRFGETGSESKAAPIVSGPSEESDGFTELEAVLADMDVRSELALATEQEETQGKTLADLNSKAEQAFKLYSAGEVVQAKTILDDVLKQDSTRVDALGVRGVIAWQEGDMDGAVVLLEKALALDDSNARAHNYMGIVQNSLQNQDRAEKEFRKAIQLDANYEEPLFNLAVVIVMGDDPRTDEARKYYERSLLLGSTRNEDLEEILYP